MLPVLAVLYWNTNFLAKYTAIVPLYFSISRVISPPVITECSVHLSGPLKPTRDNPESLDQHHKALLCHSECFSHLISFLHHKPQSYLLLRLLPKYQSPSFGSGRAWPSAQKIFFLIINITMFFYINNNVKGFLLRKEGKRGFPK